MLVGRNTRNKTRQKSQSRIDNRLQISSKAKKAKKGSRKCARTAKQETAKQREERLVKNREKVKKWRQRMKENPETYEKYLNAEKERYQKRKKQGTIQSMVQLSDREKRPRRKQNKAAQKRCRLRKQHLDVPNAITDPIEVIKEKKKRRKLVLCYKNNRNLRSKNDFMHKKYKSLSKRFQRLKIQFTKRKKDPSSPLKIVNKFLLGRSVPEDVRRRLVSFIPNIIVHGSYFVYNINRSFFKLFTFSMPVRLCASK